MDRSMVPTGLGISPVIFAKTLVKAVKTVVRAASPRPLSLSASRHCASMDTSRVCIVLLPSDGSSASVLLRRSSNRRWDSECPVSTSYKARAVVFVAYMATPLTCTSTWMLAASAGASAAVFSMMHKRSSGANAVQRASITNKTQRAK